MYHRFLLIQRHAFITTVMSAMRDNSAGGALCFVWYVKVNFLFFFLFYLITHYTAKNMKLVRFKIKNYI